MHSLAGTTGVTCQDMGGYTAEPEILGSLYEGAAARLTMAWLVILRG